MALAAKGYSVVLFEKNQLGGTCLNRGCIPTKSMIHSSEIYKQTLETAKIGLNIEIKSFDFTKVIETRERTVEKIRKSLELVLKNSKVKTVHAEATILNPTTILADKEYSVGKIIIATGSKPKEIRGLEFDGEFILSSDDVLKIETLPKTVLIIGSGAIGIEWARIFTNFGVDVTVVELAEHLIPLADIDVSKRIERLFEQQKIKFYLKDSIAKIENKKVILNSGVILEPDFILAAIGRQPVIPQQIEGCDIIGDACGQIQLAHYAIQQGKNLAVNEFSNIQKELIPSVIYGSPEIAWVGKREQDCDENCKIVTLPITALGKSWCDDSTNGFIKIITQDKIIIGASVISKEASALIQELLIAIQNKISVDTLKNICFAHPTYSEGICEALYRLQ